MEERREREAARKILEDSTSSLWHIKRARATLRATKTAADKRAAERAADPPASSQGPTTFISKEGWRERMWQDWLARRAGAQERAHNSLNKTEYSAESHGTIPSEPDKPKPEPKPADDLICPLCLIRQSLCSCIRKPMMDIDALVRASERVETLTVFRFQGLKLFAGEIRWQNNTYQVENVRANDAKDLEVAEGFSDPDWRKVKRNLSNLDPTLRFEKGS